MPPTTHLPTPVEPTSRRRGPTDAAMVLVHGSWDDEHAWDALVPHLSGAFRVVAYARRGHEAAAPDDGGATRRDHEDDLADRIERLGAGPAHVVGNSYGGLVALGLLARRPELFRSAAVHEPPALLLAGDSDLADVERACDAVCAHIASGRFAEAARRFVDEVALGPGAWAALPGGERATMLRVAPTFLAEWRDRQGFAVDTAAVRRAGVPLLLTRGTSSPPWLRRLAGRLAAALPDAAFTTMAGAGHVPHVTHPESYAPLVAAHVGAAA